MFKIKKLTKWTLFATVLRSSFTALGGALGSERVWLLGSTVAVTYGFAMAWMIWINTLLQTMYNIAFARMTTLMDEPAIVYLNRAYGRHFWIVFNAIGGILSPGMAWLGHIGCYSAGLYSTW